MKHIRSGMKVYMFRLRQESSMIVKNILIDGKKVKFRASATIPRLYIQLTKNSDKNKKDDGGDIENLELFENVAYIMAKHADPAQPDTPEEWLEQFNVLSLYQALPDIIELWRLNNMSVAESKKKFNQQFAR